MKGRVLIVDDDREMVALLERGLTRRSFAVAVALSGEDALAYLADHDVDLVVTDLNLGAMSGLVLTERIVANRPGVPVIVLTAFGSLESAIGAIRVGAYDFLSKPIELEALVLVVERALRHRQLTDELVRLRREVATGRGGELVGESQAVSGVTGTPASNASARKVVC